MKQLIKEVVLALATCWIGAALFLSGCTMSYAVAYKAINGPVVKSLNRMPAGGN